MEAIEGDVTDWLPVYDELCIVTNTFPEHIYSVYDRVRASMEAAVSRIGESVREQEFALLRQVSPTQIIELSAKDAGETEIIDVVAGK